MVRTVLKARIQIEYNLTGEIVLQRQKNWCLLCLLCIGLVGCSSFIDFRRSNDFGYRIGSYSQAIRWSEFEKAQGYVRMREGEVQIPDFDYLKNIKVTNYQSTNKRPAESFEELTSDIILVYEIDYFIKDSYKIKQLSYEQLWWYDIEAGNWFLDSGLPKFEQ